MLIHLYILLLFFLALVEEPLAGLSEIIIVQCEGSFALLFGKVAAEAVIKLFNVFLVDFFVVLIGLSVQRELIKDNLQYFLIILILLLLG